MGQAKMVERFQEDLRALDEGIPATQLRTSMGKFADYLRTSGKLEKSGVAQEYRDFVEEISKTIPDEKALLEKGRSLLSALRGEDELS